MQKNENTKAMQREIAYLQKERVRLVIQATEAEVEADQYHAAMEENIAKHGALDGSVKEQGWLYVKASLDRTEAVTRINVIDAMIDALDEELAK